MKEVQSSERTYSLALFTVVKVYMPILKPVLSASEFKTLFCNVEEVRDLFVHIYFFVNLFCVLEAL